MYEWLQKGARYVVADARHYQILCLACLAAMGTFGLDIGFKPMHSVAMVLTTLTTQGLFTLLFRLPVYDPRSPLISGFSLSLLLQTQSLGIAVLAGFLTIASKFLIRWRGKHIFNPTNITIVTLILLSDAAWVSSGQWGSAVWGVFLVACLGSVVVNRVGRSDITIAVLGFYAALLFSRALWLGDPLAIPIHQLQSGALLIFAFFMISDPKTTPDSRAGRILFAMLVVGFAGWVQFGLFHPNGLLYALAFASPFTPLVDKLLPSRRFQWKPTGAIAVPIHKGAKNETKTSSYPGDAVLPHAVG
ncbi:MAG: RnfABCDGE type electron transport complex subunit D [Candidatus Hydrogenedentes bacterium]|nr:RnfABCDGE type electron transport complex subunit D [Candidatus Hydrogenedentota bacterium]